MSKILLMGVSCLLLLSQVNETSAMQGSPPPPPSGKSSGVGKGLLRANLNFMIQQGLVTITNPNCTVDGIVSGLIDEGRLSMANLPRCTGMEGGVEERRMGDYPHGEREEKLPMTSERLKRMGGQEMVGETGKHQFMERLQKRKELSGEERERDIKERMARQREMARGESGGELMEKFKKRTEGSGEERARAIEERMAKQREMARGDESGGELMEKFKKRKDLHQ